MALEKFPAKKLSPPIAAAKMQSLPQILVFGQLQFVGELRAKKIYGRAIGGNNFSASNKEPYGTPSFKAATDMPTVNNQRALPSG